MDKPTVLARFKCHRCDTYNPPIVNGDECGACEELERAREAERERAREWDDGRAEFTWER